ncbi:ATP-binding protein [Streptomyces xiaopingdaonensis]|uniref:ATP-binding protein n=1 Tax=Streptomyces xiaopingdaonensis TaxID=1565415 RepID=UPI0002E6F297|nr:ATP-binding protein [Streptomyces xiaopingdaonensis]
MPSSPLDATSFSGRPALESSPEHRWHLPARHPSVRRARHTLDTWLSEHSVPPDTRETAVLILSELATNAITHTNSATVTCRICLLPQGLHVEVHDHDPVGSAPHRRSPGPEAEHGRGLHIVDSLAENWGVSTTPHTHGHAVWAQLPSSRRHAALENAHPGRDVVYGTGWITEAGEAATD